MLFSCLVYLQHLTTKQLRGWIFGIGLDHRKSGKTNLSVECLGFSCISFPLFFLFSPPPFLLTPPFLLFLFSIALLFEIRRLEDYEVCLCGPLYGSHV